MGSKPESQRERGIMRTAFVSAAEAEEVPLPHCMLRWLCQGDFSDLQGLAFGGEAHDEPGETAADEGAMAGSAGGDAPGPGGKRLPVAAAAGPQQFAVQSGRRTVDQAPPATPWADAPARD